VGSTYLPPPPHTVRSLGTAFCSSLSCTRRTRCDELLGVASVVSLLMIRASPGCRTYLRRMPIFNIKPARETCVHVGVTLDDVGVCCVCRTACSHERHSWYRMCSNDWKASACLTCNVVCKWCARVLPTALALASASVSSSTSRMSRCSGAASVVVADGWDVELGGELHCSLGGELHFRGWSSGRKCRNLLSHCLLVGGELVDGVLHRRCSGRM
jgi:hypothetical protein